MASVGSLVVDLRGNTAQFQSDMGRASSILNRNVASMKQSVAGLTRGFEAVSKAAAAFGVALSVGAVVNFLKQAASGVADLQHLSQQLAFNVEALQALQEAGRDAGISTESVTGAITRLNEAIGEATGGNRQMQQSFVDLGVSFKNANGTARDNEAVFQDIAKRYQEAGDKTKFLSDVTNVMGRDAGNLRPLFEAAAGGVDKLTASMKDAGRIAGKDMVASLDTLSNKIGAFVHWLDIKGAEAVHGWQLILGIGLSDQAAISREFDQKFAELQKLKAQRADMLAGGMAPQLVDVNAPLAAIIKLEDRLRELQKLQAAIMVGQGGFVGPPTLAQAAGGQAAPPAVDAATTTKAIKEQQSALADLLDTMRQELTINSTSIGQQAEIEAAYKASDAAQRDYAAGLRDSPLLTGEELDMLKNLHDEDVARQNVAAAVKAQQNAYAELDKQAAELKEQQAQTVRELVDGVSQIGAGLVNAAAGFRTWKEAAADALDTVFQMVMNLINTTGFFGLFPAAAGGVGAPQNLLPGRAAGGPVMAGSAYMVGERGPEMFVPSRSGTILPHSGDGGTVVNVINNTGTMARTSERNDGGRKIIDVTIDEATSKSIRDRGGLAQTLESTYGLTRRGR